MAYTQKKRGRIGRRPPGPVFPQHGVISGSGFAYRVTTRPTVQVVLSYEGAEATTGLGEEIEFCGVCLVPQASYDGSVVFLEIDPGMHPGAARLEAP